MAVFVNYEGAIRGGCLTTDDAATIGWKSHTLTPVGPVGYSPTQVLSVLIQGTTGMSNEELRIFLTNACSIWWTTTERLLPREVGFTSETEEEYLRSSPWAPIKVGLRTFMLLANQLEVNFELYEVLPYDQCSRTTVEAGFNTTVKILVQRDYRGEQMYHILDFCLQKPFTSGAAAVTEPATYPPHGTGAIPQETDDPQVEISDAQLERTMKKREREKKALEKSMKLKEKERKKKADLEQLGFHSEPYEEGEERPPAGLKGPKLTLKQYLASRKQLEEGASLQEEDFPALTSSSSSVYITPEEELSPSYVEVVTFSSQTTPSSGESPRSTEKEQVTPTPPFDQRQEDLVDYLLPKWARIKLPRRTTGRTKESDTAERPAEGVSEDGKDTQQKRVTREKKSSKSIYKSPMGTSFTRPTSTPSSSLRSTDMASMKKYQTGPSRRMRAKLRQASMKRKKEKKALQKLSTQESSDPDFYSGTTQVEGIAVLPHGTALTPEELRANTAHRLAVLGIEKEKEEDDGEYETGESTDSTTHDDAARPQKARKKTQRPFVLKGDGKGGLKRGKVFEGDVYVGPKKTSRTPSPQESTTLTPTGTPPPVLPYPDYPMPTKVGLPTPYLERSIEPDVESGEVPFKLLQQVVIGKPPPSFAAECMLVSAELYQHIHQLTQFIERLFSMPLWVKETRVASLYHNQPFCLTDGSDITIYSLRLDEFIMHVVGSQIDKEVMHLEQYGFSVSRHLILQLNTSIIGPLLYRGLVDEIYWSYMPKPVMVQCIISLLQIKIGCMLIGTNCTAGNNLIENTCKLLSLNSEDVVRDQSIIDTLARPEESLQTLFTLAYKEKYCHLSSIFSGLSGVSLTKLDLINTSEVDYESCASALNVLVDDDHERERDPNYTPSISMDLLKLEYVVDYCSKIFSELYPDGDVKCSPHNTDYIKELRIKALKVIEDYFIEWNSGHTYTLVNPDMLEASIKCLAQHASRIASFREIEMSQTDYTVHKRIMNKLFKILEGVDLMPMVEICRQVGSAFEALLLQLPNVVRQEVQQLYNNLLHCNSYSDAWQYGTRIKGVAYEGFFSKKYGLEYCPELLKPNLDDIVKTVFPLQYNKFLMLSAKHPEVRTLTPDFYIHRRSVLGFEMPHLLKQYIRESNVGTESKTSLTSTSSSDTIVGIETREGSGVYKYKVAPDESKEYKKQFSRTNPDTDLVRNLCVSAVGEKGQLGKVIKESEVIAYHIADDEAPFIGDTVKVSEEDNELVLFEVGYVTDPEQKMEIDMSKWSKASKILKQLDISTTLIIATDISSRSIEKWWISAADANLLKKSLGTLFYHLIKYTPTEIKDRIVGGISTLKYNVSRRSGSTVKTPVTVGDVKEYFSVGKEKIVERPNGTILPPEVVGSFEASLVNGCAISEEGSVKVMDMLKRSAADIVLQYANTKNAEELLDNEFTKVKVLAGWLLEEYKNRVCSDCFKLVDEKMMLRPGFIEELVYLINTSVNVRECCRHTINTIPCSGPLPLYLTRCPPLIGLRICQTSGAEQTLKSELDIFISTAFPSRSPTQKKLKRLLEKLCRSVLDLNGISAVKNSKGMLFLNSTICSELSQKICVPKLKIKPCTSKALKEKIDNIVKNIQELFKSSELEKYSDHHKQTVFNLIDKISEQKDSNCELKHSWVMKILDSLRLLNSPSEVLLALKKTIDDRKENAPLNDSFRVPTKSQVVSYLQSFLSRGLGTVGVYEIYTLDCLIFKEVIEEATRRFSDTPYVANLDVLANSTKLLLKLGWYQNLILYSKICMLYSTACSEFTSAGVKVLKVPHTSLNLVVKLSASKKSNSTCSLFDLDFNEVVPPFFMNRCVATIGQAMPFVILVLFIQMVQNYKCLDAISCTSSVNLDRIRQGIEVLHENLQQTTLLCYDGEYDTALKVFETIQLTQSLHNQQSSTDRLERVIASFTISMGCVLVPAMLLNSLNFNSQIQKMRFTMLMSLAMIGRPTEMGGKMYAPSRRVETFVAKLYLQLSSYAALSGIKTNARFWKQDMYFPKTSIPSLSLYGVMTCGDRQFLTDIYLVHIHNKELDNFDQGSIAVLEELADRHFCWEDHVKRVVEEAEDGKLSKKEKKSLYQELRLLLGVVRLDQPTDKDSESISTPMSPKSGSFKTSSRASSIRSWGKDTVYSISEISELYPNVDQEGQLSLRQTELCTIYTPSTVKLQDDISTIICQNPSYTMGSPEILQAMTEYGKCKFPEIIIQRAKKDPRNWTSIATVSESTAIVPGPLRVFDIRMAADTMKRMQGTKLKKILKNRLNYLGGVSKKDKTVKEVAKELEELLGCIDTVDQRVKDEVKRSIVEAKSLKQVTWQYAVKLPIEQTLMTVEGHNIFYWLKSLQKDMNKIWNDPNFRATTETENVKVIIGVLKDLSSGNIPSITPAELESLHSNVFLEWDKSLDICIGLLEIDTISLSAKIPELVTDFQQVYSAYRELVSLKRDNPDISFKRQERELKQLEVSLLRNHNSTFAQFTNLLFITCFSCPWLRSLRHQEGVMLQTIFNEVGLKFTEEKLKTEFLRTLLPMMCVRQLLSYYLATRLGDKLVGNYWNYEPICRYCIAMFSSNSTPMSYVHVGRLSGINTSLDNILQSATELTALYAMEGQDYDFSLTVKVLANSSQAVVHKLTGRNKGERLPRSTRSKVIYEVIKLIGTSSTAILQEVVFDKVLDTTHEFFSTLAPKAQLGGNRDLFVQETTTKLIHATTEIFSKTLLSQTKDDGLTNQHLKEDILTIAHKELKLAEERHGSTAKCEEGSTTSTVPRLNFYRTLSVAGDNTKWGPIHCCSFFSLMYQQLLLKHPDWKHFIMLVMLKDLNKEIEIPIASISKIMNSLVHDETFIHNTRGKTTPAQLYAELARIAKDWNWKPLVKDIILTYLVKGKMCLQCYNHMGQGIHHATSSVLTSLLAKFTEDLLIDFVEQELPGLHCKISHAGSSDDYAKVIVTYGMVEPSKFEILNAKWKHTMLDAKNLMSAVSRLVQVKDSAKTLSGTVFAEFYSEFVLYHRTSPAGIKFILTGLINSSVTSPVTMAQACQVSSQQAMFNSVSQLTNFAFTICRQQVYFNFIEAFIRKYGRFTLNGVSSFNRLYLPIYSNMIDAGLVIEDIEQTVSSLNRMSEVSSRLPRADYDVFLPDGRESTVDSSPEESSSDELIYGEIDPNDDRCMTSRYQKVRLPKEIEDTADIVRRQLLAQHNTNYIGDCDSAISIWYNNQECIHHNNQSCVDFMKNFVRIQPIPIKTLCLVPSGDTRFLSFSVEEQNYSVSLTAQVMCDVLTAIIFSYYKRPQTLDLGKKLKASYDREESTFFEDPFIQVKPNSLDRELKRLKESRVEIKTTIEQEGTPCSYPAFIADQLVKMNNMTEDYLGETERLLQAISSRSIIWGLAGGLKELSIPIYSIFFKSYFFVDHTNTCGGDKWVSSKNEGHMDSKGRSLGEQIRTKFSYWIDTMLSCKIHSSTLPGFNVLDEKSSVCSLIPVNHTEDGVVKIRNHIGLDGKLCSRYANELTDLILQFSDHNRLKIKVLESSHDIQIRPADMVTISKTRLFSRGVASQIMNNPAVVVAYRLNADAVYTLKPRGICYSSLEAEGMYIEDLHPSIKTEILKIISMHNSGESFDPEVAREKAKIITTLCRLASSSRFNITSFYALRPTLSADDTNISEVISYGIQENKQITMKQQTIDYSSYSERYFIILEAISVINHLPYEDDLKTNLMQNFLTWIPSAESVIGSPKCGFREFYSSLLSTFGKTSLAHILDAEQYHTRKESDRRSCSYLSLFALNPSVLQTKVPYTGGRITFRCKGDQSNCGNFTLSSADGNAVGIFHNGSLYIHVDHESAILITEAAKHILKWVTGIPHENLTPETCNQFLRLLPRCKKNTVQNSATEGMLLLLRKGPTIPTYIEPVRGFHRKAPYIYIKPNILSIPIEKAQSRQPICCAWLPGKLTLYYSILIQKLSPSGSITTSLEILSKAGLSQEYEQLLEENNRNNRRVVIATIELQRDVSLKSMALLHLFLNHLSGFKSYSIGTAEREASLYKLATHTSMTQVQNIHKRIKDSELEVSREMMSVHNPELMNAPKFLSEHELRDILNSVLYEFSNSTDWVSVQIVLDLLNMENSMVINTDLSLRGHQNWKIVPTSLSLEDPSCLFSYLLNSLVSVDSYRCTPLLCRLSLVEDYIQELRDLCSDILRVMQYEGLRELDLHCFFVAAALFNMQAGRGRHGVLSCTEVLKSILPIRTKGPYDCTIEMTISQGIYYINLSFEYSTQGPEGSQEVRQNVKLMLELLLGPNPTRRFKQLLHSSYGGSKTGKVSYELLLMPLRNFITFNRFCSVLVPNYTKNLGKSLTCRVLHVLIGSELVDDECTLLKSQYPTLSQGISKYMQHTVSDFMGEMFEDDPMSLLDEIEKEYEQDGEDVPSLSGTQPQPKSASEYARSTLEFIKRFDETHGDED
nr:L protein [Bunyavirales sp.]